MKTVRPLLVLGLISAVAAISLSAQTTQPTLPPSSPVVEFISVSREEFYIQTDATTVTPNLVMPARFSVEVEGQDMTSTSPLTAVSFNWPDGSPTPLTFNAMNEGWSFQSSFPSMSALNGVYGTGTYIIDLTGTPTTTVGIAVSSFAGSTLQIPQLTLTGGTWMGNAYVLGPTDSLSITFNPVYTGTVSGTQGFHYDGWIGDNMASIEVEGFINFDPTTNSSVPGGATPSAWMVGMLPVGLYSMEVGYSQIQNPTDVLDSAKAVSLLEYRTNLQLVVVPEPSTYALCALGLGVLGLAHWRRRRQV